MSTQTSAFSPVRLHFKNKKRTTEEAPGTGSQIRGQHQNLTALPLKTHEAYRYVRKDTETLSPAEKRVMRAPCDVAGDEGGSPGEAISRFSSSTNGVHGTLQQCRGQKGGSD